MKAWESNLSLWLQEMEKFPLEDRIAARLILDGRNEDELVAFFRESANLIPDPLTLKVRNRYRDFTWSHKPEKIKPRLVELARELITFHKDKK